MSERNSLQPARRAAATPAGPPEDGFAGFAPPEVWRVLERQSALYTGMESSSLPVETARELLESVLFCVETTRREAPLGGQAPLAQWLLAGQRILYGRREAGLRLQKAAEARSLRLDNPVYREVLDETRYFFTWYDIRFLAHQIPCMIDYPLALAVDDALRGVDYILEYLRRRLWEDTLCGCFPPSRLEALLEAHSPGWRELPLNLFEPVLAAALGPVLLGQSVREHRGSRDSLAALAAVFEGQNAGGVEELLARAAARLCNELRIWGTAQRGYYAACARAMAPRVDAADREGLRRIFLQIT